jgi:hypothetical protein
VTRDNINIIIITIIIVGRGRVVGIATCCGMNVPVIESWRGPDFLHPPIRAL